MSATPDFFYYTLLRYLLYTLCLKLNDSTLKPSTDETIAEKILKFCIEHDEGMGIWVKKKNNKNSSHFHHQGTFLVALYG